MEDEYNTLDSLDDESHVNSASEEGAVSNESKPQALSLEEINSALGKNFKDVPTALKAWKDTISYVGKKKEDILKEVTGNTENVSRELKEIKTNMFFDKNPEYAPYRKVMEKMGDNPVEIANSEEFKLIFEKAKGFDENQKLKSVLVSNPRLAQTKDALTKARETSNSEERDELVAQAVLATIE